MKTIKGTTKRGKAMISVYNLARKCNIYEAYERPSSSKIQAWGRCVDKMLEEGGKDIRLMSYNTFKFTCGWITANGLRVETADQSYLVELSNEQFTYMWK